MTKGILLRLVALLGLIALLFVLLWNLEGWVLDRRRLNEQRTVALRDLKRNEYLTAAHVKGPDADKLIGKFLFADKKKGDFVTPGDVRPVARDRSVVPLVLGPDRSLGDALVVGLCVDVWSAAAPAEPIATNLEVVTVLPFAPDGKRLVFFGLGASQRKAAGALITAKEPMLSIGQCALP